MELPQMIPVNVPPGLEYLATVRNLYVVQQIEFFEGRSYCVRWLQDFCCHMFYFSKKMSLKFLSVFIGFETNNRYTILNDAGQRVYFAIEINDWFTRSCLGSSRSFDINILDHARNNIIHIQRDFACDSCLCPCCLQVLNISILCLSP